MPEIALRGVPHYYQWITDQGDARDPLSQKPVLLFVHGWGGSSRYWQSTAHALVTSYDCLLYDLRGFGRSQAAASSPRDPIYEMGYYAAELSDLIHQLGLGSVIINAHSMGASLATLLAARAPEQVRQLILTCSGIFAYNPVTFPLFHQIGGGVVSIRPRWLGRIPGMDRLFMARFLHRPLPFAFRQAFLEDYLNADQTTLLGTIYTAVSQQASQEMPSAFAQLGIPTLLIAGEKDIIIPTQLGQAAARLNPIIQYVEIPRTAHFPMLEDSSAYLSIVQAFLSQGDPLTA
ncbi:MAG: alpha/beta hydrolase [Cyanobacteriota bacterium]|nr:alpha/beta hydrolase [Cyanobacteriota bacterium]